MGETKTENLRNVQVVGFNVVKRLSEFINSITCKINFVMFSSIFV